MERKYTEWTFPLTPREQDEADERVEIEPEFASQFVPEEVIPVIVHQVECDCKELDIELAKINDDLQRYYDVTDMQHSPDIIDRIKDGYLRDWLFILNKKELFKFVADGNKIKLLRPHLQAGVLTIGGILHLRNQVASLRRLLPRVIKLAALIDTHIGMNRILESRATTSESTSERTSASTSASISASTSDSISASTSASTSASRPTSRPSSRPSSRPASRSETLSGITTSSELLTSGSETLSASESASVSASSSRPGSVAESEIQ